MNIEEPSICLPATEVPEPRKERTVCPNTGELINFFVNQGSWYVINQNYLCPPVAWVCFCELGHCVRGDWLKEADVVGWMEPRQDILYAGKWKTVYR